MDEGRQQGVITDWGPRSSFGYARSGDERAFLHIGNFIRRGKWPEEADRVSFVWGKDPQGRPCAQEIVLLSRGSVLSWAHFVVLAALLVVPALAVPKLGDWLSPWWLGLCVAINSSLVTLNLWLDKRYAISSRYRIPEATLHLFELMGGWPGSYLAQRFYRHKISKKSYQVIFWMIVAIHQLFALDLILGGFFARGLEQLGAGQV